MQRRLRGFVRSLAIAVLLTAGVTAVSSPARAAVPDPVFIQDLDSFRCLEQQWWINGPETSVTSKVCNASTTTQQWGVLQVSAGIFKVVNHASGWCLSHPNLVENS